MLCSFAFAYGVCFAWFGLFACCLSFVAIRGYKLVCCDCCCFVLGFVPSSINLWLCGGVLDFTLFDSSVVWLFDGVVLWFMFVYAGFGFWLLDLVGFGALVVL